MSSTKPSVTIPLSETNAIRFELLKGVTKYEAKSKSGIQVKAETKGSKITKLVARNRNGKKLHILWLSPKTPNSGANPDAVYLCRLIAVIIDADAADVTVVGGIYLCSRIA